MIGQTIFYGWAIAMAGIVVGIIIVKLVILFSNKEWVALFLTVFFLLPIIAMILMYFGI